MPLVAKLHDNGSFESATLRCAEKLCTKLSEIFPPEPSALLHGDLWSGNFFVAASGHVAIFDPAVYYGHREMDLGMSLLFGGFDRRFYEAYNACYPLEAAWRQRVQLTQLYPLLVHAVLFGGHYVSSCKNIIEQYK
jgi:fructosamine-3-kinase